MTHSELNELNFYRSLSSSMNGFLYVLNMNPYKVEWVSDNKIVNRLSGSTPEQVIKNGAFIPAMLLEEPDFRESIVNAITAFEKDPETKWGGVFRFVHESGDHNWIAYTSSTMERDDQGRATKIACMGIPFESLFQTPDSMKELFSFCSKKFNEEELATLTSRQLEFLKMIGQGMIRKEMAKKLELSITTIDDHKKSLLKKFDCQKMSDLGMVAQRLGLAYPHM